jgi:hypothetical protein
MHVCICYDIHYLLPQFDLIRLFHKKGDKICEGIFAREESELAPADNKDAAGRKMNRKSVYVLVE